MAKARLLQVACSVAMLAASPVFAQNNTQTGDAAAGGAANAPATHDAMPGSMAPASTGPAGSEEPMHKMAHHHGGAMRGSKGDRSQDAMVDRLNEQSLQAAQQGQSFSVSGSGAGNTAPASGAGMHDMPASGAPGGGKM
jgi:hypothetical protein